MEKKLKNKSIVEKTPREKLIECGLIIEDTDDSAYPEGQTLGSDDDSDKYDPEEKIKQFDNTFVDANYEIQNEIIKFFINNPVEQPEIFRQYGISLGIDPEEFQHQANILLSQLLKIYLNDMDSMGYNSEVFSDDDALAIEIQKMISPDESIEDEKG